MHGKSGNRQRNRRQTMRAKGGDDMGKQRGGYKRGGTGPYGH